MKPIRSFVELEQRAAALNKSLDSTIVSALETERRIDQALAKRDSSSRTRQAVAVAGLLCTVMLLSAMVMTGNIRWLGLGIPLAIAEMWFMTRA